MAFPTGWGRKCKITIPDAQIQGSHTDFPILLTEVNFPAEMLDGGANSALNGGGDVRFSEDSAGSIRLACDMVSFVAGGAPFAEIHTKLPTLNTGAAKEFYVWYKKAGEVQPAVTDPFGRNAVWADEELVLHLNSTSPIDSTGNHIITKVGLPSLVTDGPGGISGLSFDGTLAEYLRTGITARLSTYSVRSICRGYSAPGSGPSGNTGPVGGNENLSIAWHHANSAFRSAYGRFGGTWQAAAFATRLANVIYNLGATYDGSNLRAYQDGVLTATTAAPGLPGLPNNLTIAAHSSIPSQRWDGDVFTVRIRSGVVSDDWLVTEDNNQLDPATFASAGTPQAVGGGLTITIQNTTSVHSADNISLSQLHSLNVNDGLHSQIVDSPALFQGQTLFISDIAHDMSSDASALIQTHMLTIGSSDHGLTGNGAMLGTGNSLLISGGVLGTSSDAAILQQIQSLITQNANHGLTSDEGGVFDPTAFIPSPGRLCIAEPQSRKISPASDQRSNQPTNH